MNFLTFESLWPSRREITGDPLDDDAAPGQFLARYWLAGLLLLLIGALVAGVVANGFFIGLFVASLGLIFLVAGIVASGLQLGTSPDREARG